MSAHAERAEQRVTPLELFFDLVFVFAMTRVTALMAHDLSWATIGQGLLVLAALWWGWSAYAWLTNHVAGEDFRARLVVFVSVAAMVLVALAVPEAFGDHGLLFALGYLVMRMAHLGLYWVASGRRPRSTSRSRGCCRPRSPARCCWWPRHSPTARSRPASGCWRWRSTTAARSCAAWPATACTPRTSPSVSR